MQILWPAVRFSQLAEQLQNVRISADRLFEILDARPQITDPHATAAGFCTAHTSQYANSSPIC
jgi:ABC-type multidrug transport system fused ATPase/permease subunit